MELLAIWPDWLVWTSATAAAALGLKVIAGMLQSVLDLGAE